jgi:cysteine desulfurase
MKVYFDYNATTPVDRRVLDAMLPILTSIYGNPSSIHEFGREASKCVEESREKVAELIGALPTDIVFTGSGTEATNMAIKGVVAACPRAKKHIITTDVEHSSVRQTFKHLEKQGVATTFLPVNGDGLVDLKEFERAINENTILASIQHANNETGVIQPIAEMAQICKARGVCLHTDSIQAVGKIPLNVKQLGVDMMSISAHKFYGPKGVGALYVHKTVRIEPCMDGGEHEGGRRAGTHNVAGIVGMARALEIAVSEMPDTMKKMKAQRDRFERTLMKKLEHVCVNGSTGLRLPNTANIRFDGVVGESVLMNLDLEGIMVSTGSACASSSTQASHVLLAMGLTEREAESSLRFSLGKPTTDAEVDYCLEKIPEVITRLRKISGGK